MVDSRADVKSSFPPMRSNSDIMERIALLGTLRSVRRRRTFNRPPRSVRMHAAWQLTPPLPT